MSRFTPAGSRNDTHRGKRVEKMQPKTLNNGLRKNLLARRDKSSAASFSNTEALIDHLRVTTNGNEHGYNRVRLFALGKAGCGKEALLSTLFNINLQEDASSAIQPIVMGRYVFEADRNSFVKTNNTNINQLTLEVWNYSWKVVYNYLQDMFMTNYAVYLFVYDMKKILSDDPSVRNASLTYLETILHTKKLHAPKAPVILVGTNRLNLGEQDVKDCENIIKQSILKTINFEVRLMSQTQTCAAVCCDTGFGVDVLAQKIQSIISLPSFLTEQVPTILLSSELILKADGRPYLSYNEVRRLLHRDVHDDDVCELILKILSDRGVISFMYHYEGLRRFVIIKPEWLVRACGTAVYKDGEHEVLNYDINNSSIVNDFAIFVYQRVLSKALLYHVLERMKYPREVHSYILELMKSTCMVAYYLQDNIDSYLTPTFFDNLGGRTYQRRDIINVEQYKGPFFVIDFSGDHSSKIVYDGGVVYSCFMPFSFFEKLVSLAIHLSASFGPGIQPITRYKKARLSFGAEVDFMMSVMNNKAGRAIQIKVSTLSGTSQEKANDLLERIFSMARGIRKDFYDGVENVSRLALNLLVPPKNNSEELLTDYEEIQQAKSTEQNVKPNFRMPGSLSTSEFDRWHRDGMALKVGRTVKYVPREANGNFPLAEGKSQHCFLSYKETSALPEVQKQLQDLKALGYICWLNKEFKGALSLDVYLEQVKKSMCFILVLSENVFESPIIIEELNTAIEHNIPIMFLHHPDTDTIGYWTFSQYITSCPSNLRQLFNVVDSIQLHRRFYLQEAVTNQIVKKLREIMKQEEPERDE